MKITYNSNNSGGGWWLKDKDWKALEKAGWKVDWFAGQKREYFKPDADGRWLGALATSASKNFKNIQEALEEFERITGQNVTDEGCNCCGAPHSFEWKKRGEKYNEYASGDSLSEYLYGDSGNLSKRELLEKLNEQ